MRKPDILKRLERLEAAATRRETQAAAPRMTWAEIVGTYTGAILSAKFRNLEMGREPTPDEIEESKAAMLAVCRTSFSILR